MSEHEPTSTLHDRYGPWAVIAGASEGIGRALAWQLARAGVSCVLVARPRTPDVLGVLAREISQETRVACIAAPIDLAGSDACTQVSAAVGDREIGLFVANAGGDPHGAPFLDRAIEDWVDLVNRNVITTLRCVHRFVPPMRVRRRGGILLIGSGSCYGGGSRMATYSATKAFDLCFAESLWAELQTDGIDVLYLALTATDTPALRKLLARKGLPVPDTLAVPEDVARCALDRLPFGPVHNYGQPDDITGIAPNSPDSRRTRVLAVSRSAAAILGDD